MPYGQTPTSTTPLGTNQFPASSVYTPNTVGGNFTALEGGPVSTDSQGNQSAPASVYTKDGANVTQGSKGDGAATDSVSSWSVIALLKGLYAKLSGTLQVSGTVTTTNASVGSTGSAVPSSASYLGGNKAGNLTGLSLDGSGNLNVNIAAGAGSGGTASSFGSAFPGTGTAIGASDGTNMQGLQVESSSNKNLRVGLYSGANAASVTSANALKTALFGNAGATVDSTIGAGAAPTNQVVVGSVYNATSPAPTSGQAMAQQADQAGNLRTFPGIALTTLSAWNSSTALNATQTIFTNSGCPAVLVQIDQTTTITAGAITFEVTYDGTNWVTVPANCVLDPSSTSYAQISLPYTLQASTNKPFLVSNNGWQGLRIKLSTQITGTGTVTPYYALLSYDPIEAVLAYSPTAANFNATVVQAGTWTMQPGNTANTTPWIVSRVDGQKTTYAAAVQGLAPGATPQDIFTITGSATKTIRILYLSIAGFATSSSGLDVFVLTRSTANTGGTSSTATAVPLDSNNAAATATVRSYTANPTAGTLIGNIRTFHIQLNTNAGGPDTHIFEWGIRPGQCPVLRGTSQVFAVNLGGIAAISGWSFTVSVEWSEE